MIEKKYQPTVVILSIKCVLKYDELSFPRNGKGTYGVTGTREDFADYFPQDKTGFRLSQTLSVLVKNSPRLGVEYPEINILRIKEFQDP